MDRLLHRIVGRIFRALTPEPLMRSRVRSSAGAGITRLEIPATFCVPVRFVIILLICLLPALPAAADELRVGVILPLSGSNAFGAGIRDGCRLAEERLEADPELKGRLRVVYEDDQYAPPKTITALQKLVEVDKIGAVVTVSAGPSRAILPRITEHKLPLVAIATNDGFTKESSYAHALWMPPEIEGGALFDEMKRRGYTRIARITDENPVFVELNRIVDGLNRGAVTIVLDQRIDPAETDLKPIVAKLRVHPEVDAIALNVLPVHAGRLAREIRAVGMKQDLFAAEVFESPEAITLAEGALEGQWYVTSADPDPVFQAEFRKRFPDDLLIGAANCHDALLLLGEGVKRAGSAAAEDRARMINEYLSSVKDFHGALGTFSARPDRSFAVPAAIKVVEGVGYRQERRFP